jgi:predicted lipoprotein with Yx(FWY)xxD motif
MDTQHRLSPLPLIASLLLVVGACTSASTPSSPGATSTPAAPAATAGGGQTASPAPTSSPVAVGGGRYGSGSGGRTATPTPAPTKAPTKAPASRVVVRSRSIAGIGHVLTGPNGLTLYTLSSDPNNKSTCHGSCAANWPPFRVKTGSVVAGGPGVGGKFGTIASSGSLHQVTYRGRPLYYFSGDSSAGDANGQGIGMVWYVAQP